MLWQSRVLASAITLVVLFAAQLLGLGVAWAAEWVTGPTASIDSKTGDYTVSFKETGLPNTLVTDYELTAGTADYTLACFSSGNPPQVQNYIPYGNPSTSFASFSTRNSITGSISLTLGDTSDFSGLCQKGQKLCLVGVSYGNVTGGDTTTPLAFWPSPGTGPALSVGSSDSTTPLQCFGGQCLPSGTKCSQGTQCCSGVCTGFQKNGVCG